MKPKGARLYCKVKIKLKDAKAKFKSAKSNWRVLNSNWVQNKIAGCKSKHKSSSFMLSNRLRYTYLLYHYVNLKF